MIRDLVRTACVLVGMAVAASLVIEVRFQLAALDFAQRQAVQPMAGLTLPYPQPAPVEPKPPGRLRAFGRAVLDMADAGLGVVR
jgi:hypothetical protein